MDDFKNTESPPATAEPSRVAASAQEREERRAAALRANLRRRKAAARSRNVAP
ncbi:MAG: hypothetical protein ABI056_08735 [Caulobacteraceae bacterium]